MGNAAKKQSDNSPDVEPVAPPEVAALHARARHAEIIATHQAVLIGMLSELLASTSLEGALDAFADAMKKRFDCDRVAIALNVDDELKLFAVSQQAVLEASSSEAHLLVDAMNEACAQDSIVCWPPSSDDFGILVAHRSLAGRRLSGSLCSVPLYDQQELVGAFLLERRDQQGFPVTTLERLSACVAPMLMLHRKADRDWFTVLGHGLLRQLERYLGRERPGMRALCVLAAVLLAFSLIVTKHWKIVAPAELLSHERRLVTAPQPGFVAEMHVAAGDRVTEGQILGELDRREMELELAGRDSEIVVAEAEFRAAMASYDRQTTGIARARLAQARARREGVEQRLKRTKLIAPIDGLVVASDPNRTTGTAINRGETLFEIAPSTDFEVHVLVDESDIYDVFIGQTGVLSLRAMPGESLSIVVESVYPVAEAKGGENRFRVKAKLVDAATSMRPGQSGVVRLQGGQKSILGVLTRQLNRRLAELWWRWVG